MTFINYENQLLQLDTNQTTYYAAVNRHLNENKAGEVNIKEQAYLWLYLNSVKGIRKGIIMHTDSIL